MIAVKNVKKAYGERVVLDIPDFIFEKGLKYALLGSNGSGKSTLLKLIAGVIKPDGGEITKVGDIGYSPQKSIGFNMSVYANAALGCPDKKAYKNRITWALTSVGLKNLKRKNASRLSGGETQRLALVRVILSPHDVLLLDEPTASMDRNYVSVSENLILDYVTHNNAILLMATHSIEQARRMADVLVFMEDGRIVNTEKI